MTESKCPVDHGHDDQTASRRAVLLGGAAAAAAAAALTTVSDTAIAAGSDVAKDTVDFQRTDTAVVFIDPQNDVLSEKGVRA